MDHSGCRVDYTVLDGLGTWCELTNRDVKITIYDALQWPIASAIRIVVEEGTSTRVGNPNIGKVRRWREVRSRNGHPLTDKSAFEFLTLELPYLLATVTQPDPRDVSVYE